MRRVLILTFLSAASGGCYRYEPLTTPEPVVGTELRAHLTDEGVASLGPTLGRGVTMLDGRLTSLEENAWRFAVSQTRTGDARVVNWTGEPVTVPRAAVGKMERRVLDRPRTIRAVILSAIGGIAVGLAIKGIAGEASGNGGTTGPPPP
jgi:hypothetical protein